MEQFRHNDPGLGTLIWQIRILLQVKFVRLMFCLAHVSSHEWNNLDLCSAISWTVYTSIVLPEFKACR